MNEAVPPGKDCAVKLYPYSHSINHPIPAQEMLIIKTPFATTTPTAMLLVGFSPLTDLMKAELSCGCQENTW
jgi:hypothetical protein